MPETETLGGLQDPELIRLVKLGLMSAGSAHDLSNLLQVLGSAVRLIDRALDAELRDTLSPIIRAAHVSVERACDLSREIFDVRGSRAAATTPTSICQRLAEVQDVIILAAGPAITVEFLLDDGVPPVLCDPCALENAVLNLVVNARHAMPAGGRLRIAVSQEAGLTDDGLPCAVLRIADTGCGMSPEVASRVFDPFVTTRSTGSGTGLGLMMVREFVRSVGGSVEVQSRPGRGTLIIIRLPAEVPGYRP
ncbi:two-component system sensor histidine kinase NtrB [Sphingomonas sp. PB4P5]|uniref:two-component system sensor histidine kinase NtrB n=1 Tax=Parasphingomonas puruogangriensis TaxID=3096155 RepID=UPI002FCA6943